MNSFRRNVHLTSPNKVHAHLKHPPYTKVILIKIKCTIPKLTPILKTERYRSIKPNKCAITIKKTERRMRKTIKRSVVDAT